MFQSIVVAVDGSDAANRGLSIAAELATTTGAKLGIVYVVDSNHMEIPDDLQRLIEVEHVVDPLMHRTMIGLETTPKSLVKSMAEASAESQRRLYQFADFVIKQASEVAHRAGVKAIETRIEVGNPAERIIEFSKAQEADLIVTGKRGFGRIKSLLLGSTSHKVSQLADCSCMAIK
ncbi:MAG: nucleotide-binding universal stress UspA family protein [Gammaproteobacteria bacterium]|jgi:nucleotide-binding universal stress UspA family protein